MAPFDTEAATEAAAAAGPQQATTTQKATAPSPSSSRTAKQILHRKITWEEVEIDGILGEGSFAQVHRVRVKAAATGISPDSTTSTSTEDEDQELLASSNSQQSTDGYCSHGSNTGVVFAGDAALKRLHTDGKKATRHGYQKVATEGLQREQEILSKLPEHDYVIRFLAQSECFDEKPETGFLILEILQETTLDIKLSRWRYYKSDGMLEKLLDKAFSGPNNNNKKKPPKQKTRIMTIGLPVASAMEFLHDHHVLYRDLKPSNIGFSFDGNIKLFDFGLSRFYQKHDTDNEKKSLTLCVGSLRYMSPEVALGKNNYGFSTDVYSFAISLWEICTLQKPYAKPKTPEELLAAKCDEKQRPTLNKKIKCDVTKRILQSSWSACPDSRPTFEAIVATLSTLQEEELALAAMAKTKGKKGSSISKGQQRNNNSALLRPRKTKLAEISKRVSAAQQA